MVSTEAMPGLAAYIASKQALVGFSQSLAGEVGEQGVRVIAFGPGMVDTPGLRGVAPELAPRLGLTVDQFLNVPLHPAYAGLMPVEHAGTATAYLVAALADEYHGEVVTGYAVLERAGVIAASTPAQPAASAAPATNPPAPAAGRAEALAQARDLGAKLQAMLAETEAEFNQLPVFIRPLARNGFKGKAGQSLADWARTAARLAEQLRAADGDVPAALRAEVPRLRALFDRLSVYYAEVPAETARFTRDAGMLRRVEQIAQERVGVIRALLAALDALEA
jgi:hypothetical protein